VDAVALLCTGAVDRTFGVRCASLCCEGPHSHLEASQNSLQKSFEMLEGVRSRMRIVLDYPRSMCAYLCGVAILPMSDHIPGSVDELLQRQHLLTGLSTHHRLATMATVASKRWLDGPTLTWPGCRVPTGERTRSVGRTRFCLPQCCGRRCA